MFLLYPQPPNPHKEIRKQNLSKNNVLRKLLMLCVWKKDLVTILSKRMLKQEFASRVLVVWEVFRCVHKISGEELRGGECFNFSKKWMTIIPVEHIPCIDAYNHWYQISTEQSPKSALSSHWRVTSFLQGSVEPASAAHSALLQSSSTLPSSGSTRAWRFRGHWRVLQSSLRAEWLPWSSLERYLPSCGCSRRVHRFHERGFRPVVLRLVSKYNSKKERTIKDISVSHELNKNSTKELFTYQFLHIHLSKHKKNVGQINADEKMSNKKMSDETFDTFQNFRYFCYFCNVASTSYIFKGDAINITFLFYKLYPSRYIPLLVELNYRFQQILSKWRI